MTDSFDREITYLRLSVTDKCNLRCRYCMPAEGVCSLPHERMLSQEEMVMAVRASCELGIRKVRITGGEPLVKKNILSIVENVAAVPGIEKVAMTTNGTLLPSFARELKSAGLRSINISLDTLDAEKYRTISRVGNLEDALKGIECAVETGFERVKINTVLIGGFNDDEIEKLAGLTLRYPVDVRFIELMPMAQDDFFSPDSFIPGSVVLERLAPLERVAPDGSVARLYRLDAALGSVGIISPVSDLFCSECNRIRITADGYVKPCLHSRSEFLIKGLDYDGMKAVIEDAIMSKPARHSTLSYEERSSAGRSMNAIGG